MDEHVLTVTRRSLHAVAERLPAGPHCSATITDVAAAADLVAGF